jgi:hypothetical protein
MAPEGGGGAGGARGSGYFWAKACDAMIAKIAHVARRFMGLSIRLAFEEVATCFNGEDIYEENE